MSEVLYRNWEPFPTEYMHKNGTEGDWDLYYTPTHCYILSQHLDDAISLWNHWMIELPDGTKISVSVTPHAIAVWSGKGEFEGNTLVEYQNTEIKYYKPGSVLVIYLGDLKYGRWGQSSEIDPNELGDCYYRDNRHGPVAQPLAQARSRTLHRWC